MKRILLSLSLLISLVVKGQVTKVEAIGITVSNMAVSEKFYTNVLGFKKISDRELSGETHEKLQGIFGIRMHVVRMQLGDEFIELTDYLTPGGRGVPEDMRSNDLYFQHIAIVVSDMEKAYQHLRRHNVMHVSTAPQTIPESNKVAAGVKAFYFNDPDRHNLELIYFPHDKGQHKWHKQNGKLFLGIDHTAIAISNTQKSLQFYQTLLGFDRKGESWNMGTEQAHLNNVQGARLHITGLRAKEGAGVEFLEYLEPGPGKAFPSDTRANDVWYWQTKLVTNDAEKLYDRLEIEGYKFVSKGLIRFRNIDGTNTTAFIVRDPDGHALLITSNT